MGAIYLGKKLGPKGFEKEVVLKQLLPEYTSRPEFRDLFFREAKISATLDHANIVHTFDLVESDQSLFIVMEYVRGADLRTILRRARQRQRELSPAAAVHIALEILAGLAYAHTRRDRHGKSLDIIHRDVSPSNIICSVEGDAKLSDFGIAKASTHSSVFYRVRGKVGYMSPEQARSQPIDHRCDLYSLAVCLYESLSGERLFVGDLNTPADEIYGHPILPISQKRAGLPPVLDAVLARALAPNVADRHQSAAELSEDLRNVAHRSGLAFSAPELAGHLRDILGPDSERWLRDEPAVAAPVETQKIPPASIGLVGREAASIGLVVDVPEDEPAPVVLSPRAVSGSKDFDLDSMLNDEATRPGGVGPAPLAPRAITQPLPPPPDFTRARKPGTPPPVWTRDSGPVPILTPPPVRAAPPRATLPPAPLSSRVLPRSSARSMAIPPPFAHGARVPAPPPPRFPPSADGRIGPPVGQEFEDSTPPPPVGANVRPAQPATFDVEDTMTPLPAPFRPQPPTAYPMAPPVGAPVLNQPQTIDFSGSVPALLPEKKSGPPGWLAGTLIVASLIGGGVLAHRTTAAEIATMTDGSPEMGGPSPSAREHAPHVPSVQTIRPSLPPRRDDLADEPTGAVVEKMDRPAPAPTPATAAPARAPRPRAAVKRRPPASRQRHRGGGKH